MSGSVNGTATRDLAVSPAHLSWRRVAMAFVAFALIAISLGACAPEGEGIFTVADRNKFTATGEEYTKLTNSLLDAMNDAATKGDTAAIGTATEPIFTQIQQKITEMKDQAAKLKGQPQNVANQLISTAERWVTAAKSAVEAGKKNDATAYNEAIAKVNAIATEFNAKISEWNAIQAK